MGLPAGTKRIAPITILAASVGETATHFPWLINLASLDAAWWANVTLRGDIVVYDPSTGAEVLSFVDELDAVAKTGTLAIDASVSTAANKTYWILAVPGHGELDAAAVFTNANLFARWPLGGAASPLVDSCGNYNLTNSGAALAQTGKVGKCVTFTKDTDQSLATTAPVTQFNEATKITSSGLFKVPIPTSAAGASRVLGGEIIVGQLVCTQWNSALFCYTGSAYTDYGQYNDFNVTGNPGNWNHVGLVFDGTQTGNQNRLKLYINGVFRAFTAFGGSIKNAFAATDGTIQVSRSVAPYSLDGSADEVRYSASAKSAGWILTEYNNMFNASTSYSGSCAPASSDQGGLSGGYKDNAFVTGAYRKPGFRGGKTFR